MKPRYRNILVLVVLILLLESLSGSLVWAQRLPARNQLSQPVREVTNDYPKQLGAYFFYWWLFPNDPEVGDPHTYIAFHPPGLVGENTCFHDYNSGNPRHRPEWCIPYQGGPYNTTYYAVNNQRWWEWQFRDMASAGLDIAFLNSWDGVSLLDPGNPQSGFMTPGKRIIDVSAHLVAALDTIGNPIRIALFDDTWSEHHQWCLDNNYPLPQCDDDLSTYPMSLNGFTGGRSNKDYLWLKWRQFYDALPQRVWATHNGLPVEQGGRPLILMWHPWFFYDQDPTSFTDTLCYLKEQFFNRYGVEPFLLPHYVWAELGQTNYEATCPLTGFHILDGLSKFTTTMGRGANDFGPARFDNPVNGYSSAYVGPGTDVCNYSGPFNGNEDPSGCPADGYYTRWWHPDRPFDEEGIDDRRLRFGWWSWNSG